MFWRIQFRFNAFPGCVCEPLLAVMASPTCCQVLLRYNSWNMLLQYQKSCYDTIPETCCYNIRRLVTIQFMKHAVTISEVLLRYNSWNAVTISEVLLRYNSWNIMLQYLIYSYNILNMFQNMSLCSFLGSNKRIGIFLGIFPE